MARPIQDLILDMNYATRIISNVDSAIGMRIHLDNDAEVELKQDLSNILLKCIYVRQKMETLSMSGNLH